MEKADLRTGMRVKTREGNVYIVLKDYDTANYGHQDIFFCGEYGFLIGTRYSEDLTYVQGEGGRYDIVQVFSNFLDGCILDIENLGSLLWERTKTKEMTVEEIQQALGYKIKVVESRR